MAKKKSAKGSMKNAQPSRRIHDIIRGGRNFKETFTTENRNFFVNIFFLLISRYDKIRIHNRVIASDGGTSTPMSASVRIYTYRDTSAVYQIIISL